MNYSSVQHEQPFTILSIECSAYFSTDSKESHGAKAQEQGAHVSGLSGRFIAIILSRLQRANALTGDVDRGFVVSNGQSNALTSDRGSRRYRVSFQMRRNRSRYGKRKATHRAKDRVLSNGIKLRHRCEGHFPTVAKREDANFTPKARTEKAILRNGQYKPHFVVSGTKGRNFIPRLQN